MSIRAVADCAGSRARSGRPRLLLDDRYALARGQVHDEPTPRACRAGGTQSRGCAGCCPQRARGRRQQNARGRDDGGTFPLRSRAVPGPRLDVGSRGRIYCHVRAGPRRLHRRPSSRRPGLGHLRRHSHPVASHRPTLRQRPKVDVIHARHTAEPIPSADLVIVDNLGHFTIVAEVLPAIGNLLRRWSSGKLRGERPGCAGGCTGRAGRPPPGRHRQGGPGQRGCRWRLRCRVRCLPDGRRGAPGPPAPAGYRRGRLPHVRRGRRVRPVRRRHPSIRQANIRTTAPHLAHRPVLRPRCAAGHRVRRGLGDREGGRRCLGGQGAAAGRIAGPFG